MYRYFLSKNVKMVSSIYNDTVKNCNFEKKMTLDFVKNDNPVSSESFSLKSILTGVDDVRLYGRQHLCNVTILCWVFKLFEDWFFAAWYRLVDGVLMLITWKGCRWILVVLECRKTLSLVPLDGSLSLPGIFLYRHHFSSVVLPMSEKMQCG